MVSQAGPGVERKGGQEERVTIDSGSCGIVAEAWDEVSEGAQL